MPHLDLAYIDPGSGSLIIQVVIATLIAIPVFFRTHIARLVGFARGHKDGSIPTDDGVKRD
jgi:hypothetical protein